jgi:hypothetical protein
VSVRTPVGLKLEIMDICSHIGGRVSSCIKVYYSPS